MKNIKDFLTFEIETTKIKLKDTQGVLDTYKNLLREYESGMLTEGDFRALIKNVKSNKILYPFYQTIRKRYKIYNLTIGKK